jgi:hypothetical protein
VKQLRKRLTYANVMSSIAVFLVLGGATAIAATKIGSSQIKANAVKTGKIAKEAVTTSKIKNEAVATTKLANGAVTSAKIADKAVTGAKIDASTVGTVPTAANAEKLNGLSSSAFVNKSDYLWAIVDEDGNLVGSSGATAATRLGAGDFRVTFNRTVTNCAVGGTATDISGGAAPGGSAARIIGTDNREQTATNTVDVSTTNDEGVEADPATGDGFMITVSC